MPLTKELMLEVEEVKKFGGISSLDRIIPAVAAQRTRMDLLDEPKQSQP